MKKHADLSASGAPAWSRCSGKLRLELGLPDNSGADAVFGTHCHTIVAICLEQNLEPASLIEKIVTDEAGSFEVTQEMADLAQVSVDYVRRQPGELMVEQRLSIEHITGEKDAEGTTDAVLIEGDVMTVVDHKFGMVPVEPDEQLVIYGEAARNQFEILGDIKVVRMVIVQPRLDRITERELLIEDFKREVEAIRKAADSARWLLEGDRETAERNLVAGEKQCRFCKAKATCPELAKTVHRTVMHDFDVLDPLPVVRDKIIRSEFRLQSDDAARLAFAMGKVDLIEQWCKAVRATVERRLLDGDTVPGFKLVQGKRGNRAWIDESEAVSAMLSMHVDPALMYESKLISPTTAEKHFKDDPVKWGRLKDFVTQSEGKPSVAPEGDKRPALEIKPVADHFEKV